MLRRVARQKKTSGYLYPFYTVRLVNGSVDGWGQLQYLLDRQWSAVCAQDFNTTDAAVVCSQLGYPPWVISVGFVEQNFIRIPLMIFF